MIKIKNFKQFNESVDVDVCIDYVIGDDKLVFKSINTKDMDDKELDFLKNNDNKLGLDPFLFAEEWSDYVDFDKSYAFLEDGKLHIKIYGIPTFINSESVIEYIENAIKSRLKTGYGEFFQTLDGYPDALRLKQRASLFKKFFSNGTF